MQIMTVENRTVHYEWRNKPQHVFIDGREFYFGGINEYRWARYLQILKELGAIEEWEYEPETFQFRERYRNKRQYTPDFRITEDGEVFYQEFKTSLRQVDIRRFKLLKADFPKVKIVLVLLNGSNKTKQIQLRDNASKYVDRIMYAKPIFRQFGIR